MCRVVVRAGAVRPGDPRRHLADTSVWVEHFRQGKGELVHLLEHGRVVVHPFVFGELACGNLRARATILGYLQNLPGAPVAEHHEVLALVERRALAGTGIGWIDAHLLASALIAGASLWTLDKALATQARRLRVAVPSR